MTLIKWGEELSTGVGFVDSEHKMLVNMINELNDAMLEQHGKDVVAMALLPLRLLVVEAQDIASAACASAWCSPHHGSTSGMRRASATRRSNSSSETNR